jgi:hypothetical protein
LGHRVNDLLFVANITDISPSGYSKRVQCLNGFVILFGASTPNRERSTSRGYALGHAKTDA